MIKSGFEDTGEYSPGEVPWYLDMGGAIGASIAGAKLGAMAGPWGAVTGGLAAPALWAMGVERYKGGGAGDMLKAGITDAGLGVAGMGVARLAKPFVGALKAARTKGLSTVLSNPEARWESLKPLREAVSDLPFMGKKVGERIGASTIGQAFVPLSEKAPKQIQEYLFGVRAAKSNVGAEFAKVADNVNALKTIEERVAAQNLIKAGITTGIAGSKDPGKFQVVKDILEDLSPDQAQGVLDAISPAFARMQKVYKPLTPALKGALQKDLTKRVGKALEEIPDRSISHLGGIISNSGASGDDLQKVLGKLLKDPNVTGEHRDALQKIFDIPAMIGDDVVKHTDRAIEGVFYRKIKANSRYAREVIPGDPIPKGWRYIDPKNPNASKFTRTIKDFEGNKVKLNYAVESRTADLIEEMGELPNKARSYYNKWFLTPWKTWRVVGRVPSQVRNLFNNVVMNDIDATNRLPFYRMDVYKNAWKDMTSDAPRYKDFIERVGKGAGTVVTGELRSDWDKALRHNSDMFDAIMHYSDKLASPFKRVHQFNEEWAKYSKYIWNLEKGMKKTDAAINAVRATLDYADVTKFARLARETVLPFGTWTTKILRTMPERFVKHPLAVGKYVMIPWAITQASLNSLDMGDEEWDQLRESLPEYIKKGWFMMMPGRDDKGRAQMFNLSWWVPGLGDMAEMSSNVKNPMYFVQNPIITLTASMINNEKYGGAPIWYDWMPSKDKFTAALGYLYKSVMPTFLPGGQDYEMMWDSFKHLAYSPIEETQPMKRALTPMQAVGALGGFKIQPIAEEEVIAKKASVDKYLMGELKATMKKDIANAISDREIESIVKKYQRYMIQYNYDRYGGGEE